MDQEAHTYEPTIESFETFFRAQYPRLRKAMMLLTWSAADADDIAQEALARVYVRWERIAQMDSPEGYAYRTAVNLFYRLVKIRSKSIPIEDGPQWSDLGSQVEDADRMLAVGQALDRLTPEQRAAVVLVSWLGFTAEEAAKCLDIEAVSVRARIHRARTLLRAEGGAW